MGCGTRCNRETDFVGMLLWGGDPDKTVEGNPHIKSQAKAAPTLHKDWSEELKTRKYTFTKDTLTISSGKKSPKWTYTVKSADKKTIVINTKDSDGKDAAVITFSFQSDDVVVLTEDWDKTKTRTFLRRSTGK